MHACHIASTSMNRMPLPACRTKEGKRHYTMLHDTCKQSSCACNQMGPHIHKAWQGIGHTWVSLFKSYQCVVREIPKQRHLAQHLQPSISSSTTRTSACPQTSTNRNACPSNPASCCKCTAHCDSIVRNPQFIRKVHEVALSAQIQVPNPKKCCLYKVQCKSSQCRGVSGRETLHP